MKAACCSLLVLGLVGCSGQSGGGSVNAVPTVEEDADSFSAYGVTVRRPEAWMFLPADTSVAPDTVVLMQGPVGDAALAPAVEVAKRPLSALQRRHPPERILTTMTAEFVQLFDGFELKGAPEKMEVGDLKGAHVDISFVEALPSGEEVPRVGRLASLVRKGDVWIFRCLGTELDEMTSTCDWIVQNASF